MRAVKRFVAHRYEDGERVESRTFDRGEAIPPDWVEFIRAQSVVSEPLPHLVAAAEEMGEEPPKPPEFTDFYRKILIDDVIEWVESPFDPDEVFARAQHALDAERAGRRRSTLIARLDRILASR